MFEIIDELNNIVTINGSYETEDDDKPILEDEDEDDILIGLPEIKVAKIANKTTDAKLEDGKYKGNKTAGEYQPEEKVTFTLTTTNSGNVDLKNVILKDTMDERLTSYVTKSVYDLEVGQELKTNKGETAIVLKIENNVVVLDALDSGDSVDIAYVATLKDKSRFERAEELNNVVTVNADYETDEGDKPVPED